MSQTPQDSESKRSQLDFLRGELHAHNHRYYVLASPIISDREFDQMMEALMGLEAEHPEWADPNSPSQRVGGDLADGGDGAGAGLVGGARRRTALPAAAPGDPPPAAPSLG